MFGCYVDISDRYDPYGGTGKLLSYQCLDEMSRCDGIPDCEDKSDEMNCKLLMYSTTNRVYRPPKAGEGM